ncbi:ATP-dependent DNA helicase PIF1 [Drepanopeziza brunnea f. sp. 'multigermtubi' MB_m1]|uniref:ATP-dependent DNA helicase PIF1 n=1 Tax=Marssonina brunnea f. sp. multigermtubi (strain MB_m1) TaxID=1072389 RepID=K1XI67_MARBU|nr:ATP-dependent DNA helicase PIF1 [Drepanopeziza brunnea f. sp. 'multigermtubi' MB_m1]EKD12124.1 ATP-dependent DNA helicase PIF1 [Drepanopeziza brunnea f. sp. 'multigermtubi' MB_m1]
MIKNTVDQLTALINRMQIHRVCSTKYCLRKNKDTRVFSYRFYYKRLIQPTADYNRKINPRKYQFAVQRNHLLQNPFSLVFVLSWLANTDIQLVSSLKGLLKYASKYCFKHEKESDSYKDIVNIVLEHINARALAFSLVSKMLNKLLRERDYSAQEVYDNYEHNARTHLILHHPHRKEDDLLTDVTGEEHPTFALAYNACKRLCRDPHSDSLYMLDYYDPPSIADEEDKAGSDDEYDMESPEPRDRNDIDAREEWNLRNLRNPRIMLIDEDDISNRPKDLAYN